MLFSRSALSVFLFLGSVPFLLFQGQLAVAASLEELLNSNERPKMLQVAEALNWNFTTNPYQRNLNGSSNILNLIRNDGPSLIAKLEYAYPNAVWVPLGRDAVIAGDFLDAFYMRRGESDRVIRINASTASFTDHDATLLQDLFRGLGLINDSGLPAKRFVILDRTRYHNGSQGRLLIDSVFQSIPVTDRQRYLSEVGVVALESPLGNLHTPIQPNLDLFQFRSRVSTNPGPTSILSVTVPLTDSAPWHGTFGRFYRDASGKVLTTPGVVTDRFTRAVILAEMIEIFRILESDEFYKKLNSELFKHRAFLGDYRVWKRPLGDLISYFETSRFNFKTFGEWLFKSHRAVRQDHHSDQHPDQYPDQYEEELFKLRSFESKLIESVMGELSWDEQGHLYRQLEADLESLSPETLEKLNNDFFQLPDAALISLIQQHGAKLANLIEQLSNGLSISSEIRSLVLKKLVTFLDPARFESALFSAKSDAEINALIDLPIQRSPKHREVLERHYIQIGSFSRNPNLLKKVCGILPRTCQRGFISVLLNGFPCVNQMFEIVKTFPLSCGLEQLISNHIEVFLSQNQTLDQILEMDNLISRGHPTHKRIITRAFEWLNHFEKSPENLSKILSHIDLNDQGGREALEQASKTLSSFGRELSFLKKIIQLLPKDKKDPFLASVLAEETDLGYRLKLVGSVLEFLEGPIHSELSQQFLTLLKEVYAWAALTDKASVVRKHYLRTAGLLALSDSSSLDGLLSTGLSSTQLEDLFDSVLGLNGVAKQDGSAANVILKHTNQILKHSANFALMKTAASILGNSPREQSSFCVHWLDSVQDLGVRFEIVNDLRSMGLPIAEIIQNQLNTFFKLKPAVQQINQLIGFVPKGSEVHLSILIHSFRVLDSRSDYEQLVRPSGRVKDAGYLTAKSAFKRSHPKVNPFLRLRKSVFHF